MPSPHDLDAYLRSHASEAVAGPIRAIARTAATLSRRIARGSLGERLGATVGENADGDAQKALDVIADNAFAQALGTAGVRWLASEERADVVELDRNGTLAVAIDPLDGSSNIDVNVSIGTIFSIRTARTGGLDSFLRPGREQLAAGYVLYGPQCTLVLTVGAGVATFLLDPDSRRFHGVAENGRIAAETAEFAVNASNALHWPQPVRAYVNDCIAGADGPLRKAFNMRWVGSLVVEAHRILTRGGVFLYPGDARPGYGRGRLRMVYECAAIALVVEAAEGAATEGRVPILDLTPDTLHARAPLVFGSIEEVVRVAAYHDRPGRCASPLFGQRGLFSAGAAS